MKDAMVEAGLHEVDTYVSRCNNTVTHFIGTRPIMDLFLAEEQRLGSRVAKWWWDQDGLDVEEIQMTDREAEWTEG